MPGTRPGRRSAGQVPARALLLNLGEQGEAEELLQRWQAADAATAASLGVAGATMLCTRLLLALAKWEGDDEGEARCQAAFDAAFAHNWHALLLVCAVGNGDSPIPEGLVAELRERRLEALKKEGLKQGRSRGPARAAWRKRCCSPGLRRLPGSGSSKRRRGQTSTARR